MTNDLERKIEFAIKLIQSASEMASKVGQPIEVAYSGGKDSDCILELVRMAGVPFRAIYKNTTIDPPRTIAHVKENGVEIFKPKYSFRELIHMNGLPTMLRRHCCRYLKEYKVLDYAVVGIRSCESIKRKNRYKEPEYCRTYRSGERCRQYLPILTWTDEDVVDFIAERGIQCHPLYYDEDGNFHVERRLGCMCCPFEGHKKRIESFKKYPNMVKFYVTNAQIYLDTHPQSKMNEYFDDAYQWVTMSIFCDSIREFRDRFGPNLFGTGTDCKKMLEEKFKVKF